MTKEELIERINLKAWASPVPNDIIDKCYKILLWIKGFNG